MNKKRFSKYTAQELAEAMVFPVKLPRAKQKDAAKQLAAARKKGQKEMNQKTRLSLIVFSIQVSARRIYK